MAAEVKIRLIDDTDGGSGGGPPAPAPVPPSPYLPPPGAPGGGRSPSPFLPPPGAPGAPPAALGPSAFDRPVAVLIVGPRPLDVRIVSGGAGEAGGAPTPAKVKKPPDPMNWYQWAAGKAPEAVRAVGAAATGAAENKAMPALMEGIGAAASGLSRLGPYGVAAGAGLAAAGTAATAFKATVDAFVTRGRELSGYDGNLAGSTARADAMRMSGDIREAQQLGAQMGRLIELQQAQTEVTRELLMPVKAWMLEQMNEMMRGMLKGVETIVEKINKIDPATGAETLATIRRILALLDAPVTDEMDKWLKAAEGFVGPPAGALPAPGGGGGIRPPLAGPFPA